MRKINYIILLMVFISCGTSNNVDEPEFSESKISKSIISKELSKKDLAIKNLIPVNYPYKRNYTRIISYLYKNNKKDFIKIKGDFQNIKFGSNSAYNFMVGYWENYGQYKTSLVVMVRTSGNSKQSIKLKDVKVTSSKFGDLFEVPVKTKQTYREYPPVLFIRKIDISSKYDIIEMIKDDIITVTINGNKYEFVNPEIQ